MSVSKGYNCFFPSIQTNCNKENYKAPTHETTTTSFQSFSTAFPEELASFAKDTFRLDLAVRKVYENPSVPNAIDLAAKCVGPLLAISSAMVLGPAFGVYLLAMNIFFGAVVITYLKNTNLEALPNPKEFFSKDNLLWKIGIGIAAWFPLSVLEQRLEILITWIFGLMGIVFNQGQDVALLLSSGGLLGAIWIIYGCIIAPVTEELLFRGYSEKLFEKENNPSFSQKFMTALKTNAVFGAIHMSPFQGWFNIPIFVATFVMGMAFSLLREATGDLWAPTICHTMNNTVATIALRI